MRLVLTMPTSADYKFIRMMAISIISINFAVPFLKRL